MKNNKLLMLVLAALLLYSFVFKNKIDDNDNKIDKIAKPDEQIVSIINNAEISPLPVAEDSNKLAALYNAIYTKWKDTSGKTVNNNLQLQYFLSSVGKKTVDKELLNPDNTKKYPGVSTKTAAAISAVVGPSNDTSPMTSEEIELVGKLMHGLSWKFYNKEADNVYEQYKPKALKAIDEYNGIIVPPPTEDECICNGSGFIVHGDGHKTPCPAKGTGKCKSDATEFVPFPTDLPPLDLGLEEDKVEEKPKQQQTYYSSRRRGLLRR